jgi:hypothetical protein
MFTLPLLLNIVLEFLAKARERKKRDIIGKKPNYPCCVNYPKDSTRKRLVLIYTFRKVVGYKTNTQKPAF